MLSKQVSLGSASSGGCFLAALPLSPSFPFHIPTHLPLFYHNQQDIFYFTQQYTTQDTGDSSVIRRNGQSHREGKGIGPTQGKMPRYRSDGLNIGISGGKVVNLSMAKSFKRHKGKTVKDFISNLIRDNRRMVYYPFSTTLFICSYSILILRC